MFLEHATEYVDTGTYRQCRAPQSSRSPRALGWLLKIDRVKEAGVGDVERYRKQIQFVPYWNPWCPGRTNYDLLLMGISCVKWLGFEQGVLYVYLTNESHET